MVGFFTDFIKPLGVFLILGTVTVGCAQDPSLFNNLSSLDKNIDQDSDDDPSDDKKKGADDKTKDDDQDKIVFDQTDSFTQPPAAFEIDNPLVDILFVVDTSGSLDAERQAIVDGIQSLLNELPLEVDYRIAVLLAHLDPVGSAGQWSGKLYQKADEPIVLDADSIDKFSLKMTNPAGQSVSDGGEAGLYSLMQLLQPSKMEDAKTAGFFRDKALLNIIFVSDENAICSRYLVGISFVPDNDGSYSETDAYNDYCADANGEPIFTHSDVLVALQQVQNGNPLVVAGLHYTGENPVPSGGENEIGYGYLELIQEANDSEDALVDLADPLGDPTPSSPDPDRIAEELGFLGEFTTSAIDNLTQRFFLTQPNPDPSSIVVKVDGVDVPFTYEAPSNSVYLELEDAGDNNSVIKVEYDLL